MWILIQSVTALSSLQCPNKCSCDGKTLECHKTMPIFIPENVTKVVAYGVHFYCMLDFNDTGWFNVTHLSINPGDSVHEIYVTNETPVKLKRNTFRSLNKLEYLQVACRCLAQIDEGAFHGLDKLKVLDLSNNALTSASFVNGLKGDGNLKSLEDLYYSNTSVLKFGRIEIDTEFLNAIRTKPLKVLDISLVNSLTVRIESFRDFFGAFTSLKMLNISRTGTAIGTLFDLLFRFKLTFPGFHNLTVFDFSYPYTHNHIVEPGTLRRAGKISSLLKEVHARSILTRPLRILFSNRTSLSGYESFKTICANMAFSDSESEDCILGEINVEKLVIAENSVRLHWSKYMETSQLDKASWCFEKQSWRSIFSWRLCWIDYSESESIRNIYCVWKWNI